MGCERMGGRKRPTGVGYRAKWIGMALLAAGLPGIAGTDYASARRKIDLLNSGRLRPGAELSLTLGELNAFAANEVPDGVSHTRIEIPAPGRATGSATVDFNQLRRSQGQEPGWLTAKLLEGERPVSVTARIHSSGGQATVEIENVTISGVTIEGSTLNFLIDNILLPLYPDAVVGKPFALNHRVERIDVAPRGVTLRIAR